MKKLTQAIFRKFTRVVAEGAGQAMGERAVEAGLITAEQLRDCQQAAETQPGVPFRKVLEQRLKISPQALDVIETLLHQDAGSRRLADRYEIQEEIGQGAMGIVYRAMDLQLQRPVALKLLRGNVAANSSLVERIKREAHAVARLNHPNIPALYDIGETGGLPYLVMELLEGCSLADKISEGRLPIRTSVETIQKVAGAIHHAHLNGIVHRDLKPANIQIDKAGEPHILDFGLAHLAELGTALTATGVAIGTPLYMAPEQAQGQTKLISARTDVYALGAILYEMLTGQPPHVGATLNEVMGKIVDSDPLSPRRLNARIPADLETICMKALEKTQERRYATAGDLGADLKRFLEGEAVTARPASAFRLMRRRFARHGLVTSLAVFAVAAAIVMAVLVTTLSRRNQEVSEADRQKRDAVGEVERVKELSDAYSDLLLSTQIPMRDLEDAWLGETPGVDFEKHKAAVLDGVRSCQAKHPNFTFPLAWKGLALLFAGDVEASSRAFEMACGPREEDPLSFVIRARAHLAEYVKEVSVPMVWFHGAVHVQPLNKTERMLAALEGATRSLKRATSSRLWTKLDRASDVAHFVDGALAIGEGDYEGAAARFHLMQGSGSLRQEGDWLLGFSLYMSAHYEEAADVWERGDGWLRCLRNAALACESASIVQESAGGDPLPTVERALAISRKLVARDPTHAAGYRARGSASLRLGELQFRRNVDPWTSLTQAIEDFSVILNTAPDDAWALLQRGNSYTAWGDALNFRGAGDAEMLPHYNKALQEYRRIEVSHPEFFQAFDAHGQLLMFIGRVDDAIAVYREAIARHPDRPVLKAGLKAAEEKKRAKTE